MTARHPGADEVATNLRYWDERAGLHAASEFYDVAGFADGRAVLDDFQLAELGDVTGRSLLHLQCHIGLDTLSWARQGATVTGLDFSPAAIRQAGHIAARAGLAADFVTAEVYDAAEAVGGRRFDIVYTGTGALVWLPDVERWARTVAGLLNPGGCCYLVEFHPFADVLDDADGRTVTEDYFRTGPSSYAAPGSYADRDAVTEHNTAVEWRHGIGEVVSALAGAGLVLEFLRERELTMFARFPVLRRYGGRYRWPEDTPRVPLSYSLLARRPHR